MKRYPLKVLIGVLAVESSACFVPYSLARAPSVGTTTFGSPKPLYSSNIDVNSLLNDDAIASAYKEWRNKFGKEYDPVRFQNFENNYKILTNANVNAREKALAEGRAPPYWLDLNEYGDYSRDEYIAMKRGEPIRSTSQPTVGDNSLNTSNGPGPVRRTQEIRAPEPVPQPAPQSADTQVIQGPNPIEAPPSTQMIPTDFASGATGSRNPTWGTQVPTNPTSGESGNPNPTWGTQVIRKNEPSKGTQVIQRVPGQNPIRGTQVIQQAPTQPPVSATQVIQQAPQQQPIRGTQVIRQDPRQPPVRGTQVVQRAPEEQATRGTQVIRQAPQQPPVRGTQVVQRAPEQQPVRGTQVVQQAPKQLPVKGAQVIQQAPLPQSVTGTQVIRQPPEQSPAVETQIIQQAPLQEQISGIQDVQQAPEKPTTRGTQVIRQASTQQAVRGTQVIRPSAGPRGEGPRGTLVIPQPNGEQPANRGTRMIGSPSPVSSISWNPSKTFFDINGVGGTRSIRQASERMNGPFDGGTQVIRQAGQRAASFFSLFGGPKTAEEAPPAVQGTVKVGGRESALPTPTDGRPDTVLIEKSDLQEIIPSIFSFFGLTKKADEKSERKAELAPTPKPVTAMPSARPSLVIEKNSLNFPDTTNLPEIRRWWQNSDGSMTGFIYNSKNFNDGTRLTTSPLQRGACKFGNVVRSGGQEYLLK